MRVNEVEQCRRSIDNTEHEPDGREGQIKRPPTESGREKATRRHRRAFKGTRRRIAASNDVVISPRTPSQLLIDPPHSPSPPTPSCSNHHHPHFRPTPTQYVSLSSPLSALPILQHPNFPKHLINPPPPPHLPPPIIYTSNPLPSVLLPIKSTTTIKQRLPFPDHPSSPPLRHKKTPPPPSL